MSGKQKLFPLSLLSGAACKTESWLKYLFMAISNLFCSFYVKKHLKGIKKVENGKKSILTSFQVPTAPESWSKYTTHSNFKRPNNEPASIQLLQS